MIKMGRKPEREREGFLPSFSGMLLADSMLCQALPDTIFETLPVKGQPPPLQEIQFPSQKPSFPNQRAIFPL